MKLDRRFDVSHRFVVCVAVTHYDALEAKRICDVAIRVLLHDNLELPLHALIEQSSTDSLCWPSACHARLRALFSRPQLPYSPSFSRTTVSRW